MYDKNVQQQWCGMCIRLNVNCNETTSSIIFENNIKKKYIEKINKMKLKCQSKL
jgi:hypothetical protein